MKLFYGIVTKIGTEPCVAFTDVQVAVIVAGVSYSGAQVVVLIEKPKCAVDRRLTIKEYERLRENFDVPNKLKPLAPFQIGDILEKANGTRYILATTHPGENGTFVNLIIVNGTQAGCRLHDNGVEVGNIWDGIYNDVVRELLGRCEHDNDPLNVVRVVGRASTY